MAEAEKKEDSGKPDAAEGEAKAASGSKKKLFIIIGAAVAVLALGGGAAFMFLGGKSSDEKKGEHGEAAPAHGEAPAAHGEEKKAEGGHGKEKPAEEHGKADAEHGEAKAEGHGAKAEGEHGAAKAEGHGEAATDGKAEDKKDQVNFGESYSFKPFHLNLGNPLENHYVRMEVALEYLGGDAQKQEIEKRLPQLRDAVVSVVSRKSREFLLGPDGKDQLRREILIRVNRYMTKPIESAYITDILIE